MPLDNRELTDLEKSSGGAGGCGLITGILTIVGIVWSIVEADIDDLLMPLYALLGFGAVVFVQWLIFAGIPSFFNPENKEEEKKRQIELEKQWEREKNEKEEAQRKKALYEEKFCDAHEKKFIITHNSKSFLIEDFYDEDDDEHYDLFFRNKIYEDSNYLFNGKLNIRNKEDIVIKQETFVNGIKSDWTSYNSTGDKDGPYEVYDKNGQLRESGSYKNGKKDGTFRGWYVNGQLWYEGINKDGELDGEFKGWHGNGQIMDKYTFKDGKEDGVWKSWHENGQLLYQGTKKNNKDDGPFTTYHENGQVRESGNYRNGAKDGVWKSWHENGELIDEETIEDGKSVF